MRRTSLFEFASNILDAVVWVGFVVVLSGL
ncbi:hypothetical protein C7435_0615 [Maricaulis maris]|uniref:Uncharacterized protein n=1 Tax=Maricaulis maris TaxID=74318 RepID=A0A495DPE2_9PROT|nr:hypothetical protein C7435_0615 [Maricaulis maris]